MMKSRSSGFVQKDGGVVPEIYTAFNMGKMMKISHCFGCKFWTKPDENTSQNIAGVNVGNVGIFFGTIPKLIQLENTLTKD